MTSPVQQVNRPCIHALLGPLSLTPLLGVTDSFARALGLLMVLWVVVGVHAVLIARIRQLLTPSAELLASALLAASLVSCSELVLQAYALALYQGLGIYLPLLGIYCVLSNDSRTAVDVLRRGRPLIARFSALMVVLALFREFLGNGTLFSHAQWLFGARATHWEIQMLPEGAHLALLTPGGLILLGLLLAANNYRADRRIKIRPAGAENTNQSSTAKETLHP
ncbi:Rnf-Nqr domain containing protein [Pseudomonas sp. CCI1.2]|uniref:Rnf-Nqr domain containing protein n=1 Tax=Pseudomonas sp. CCI1.2 TaxID=3048614 RepID=UPI002B22DE35|nr:Rnf-Nqr domain containing protein [Pseudomonas sp. CCI1.2]MEB0122750.1 Rnf-Nqr domain containing protein [Pseudomonas sp. CCI1.2]